MKVEDTIKKIDWDGPARQGVYLYDESNEDYEDDTTIVMNAVGCRKCKTTAVSAYQHDYVTCQCGEVFTDGGNAYIRRGAKESFSDIIDLSVITTKHIRDFIGMVVKNSPEQQERRQERLVVQRADLAKALEEAENERNRNK